MPNWTTNKITCKKSIGDKILNKTDDGYSFDFNKLIPMPLEMNVPAGSTEHIAVASYYHSLDKQGKRELEDQLEKSKVFFDSDYWKRYKSYIDDYSKEPDKLKKEEENFKYRDNDQIKKFNSYAELGKQYIDNIINHGYSQWYDWCSEVWGTKWNVEDEVNVEYFPENDEYEIEFDTAWCVPYGIVEEYSKLCSDEEFDWQYVNEDFDGYHYLRKHNGVISDTVIFDKNKEEDFDIG